MILHDRDQTKQRIESMDLLRGLVIVLMALDHARLAFGYTPFYPTDVSQTTPLWFFTRWVTHFCAPVFVLLAGTGAFLYGEKLSDRRALSRFLLIRGFWLILLEVVWVNIFFNAAPPLDDGFVFVQVIWVLGISMIVLAGLIHLPMPVIIFLSTAVIVGHNLLDGISVRDAGRLGPVWALLHERTLVYFGGVLQVFVAYPLLPWPGVMGLGYACR